MRQSYHTLPCAHLILCVTTRSCCKQLASNTHMAKLCGEMEWSGTKVVLGLDSKFSAAAQQLSNGPRISSL